ncbi:MAG: hypothetical protein H0U85_10255 [Gemmatimonadales bacterium]|nr:hypothetical protein [Gemmatimonadales bacterium]
MSRLLLTLNLFAATAIGASNGSALLATISPYRAGAAPEPPPALTATPAAKCRSAGMADSTAYRPAAPAGRCLERHASR